MAEALSRGRAAYDLRDWQDAFDAYSVAGPLDPEDLHRYAVSAHLLGRLDDYYAIRERQYAGHLGRGELAQAGIAATWIGAERTARGELGPGAGWLARAKRHVEEAGSDGVESGWVLIADILAAEAAGDLDRAASLSGTALGIAQRFGDRDLVALALQQHGLVLLRAGQLTRGLGLLDEAMVCVAADDLSPLVTGLVYCNVIGGCWSVYELGRAMEWTSAMTAWCDAQPQLANFMGECSVHRAELRMLHGEWADARDELGRVGEADVDTRAAALAAYVRGNLDRLQGRFDDADEGFRTAARLGVDPQPGLALLRLARGSSEAAAAMLRRALADHDDSGRRVELLAAAVEVLLAVDDGGAAAEVVTELGDLAGRHDSPICSAIAAQAAAEVALHDGRPEAALLPLRSALRTWVRLRAPYPEARTRASLARACRALGDAESADRELETARGLLTGLAAGPDLRRLEARPGSPAGDRPPVSRRCCGWCPVARRTGRSRPGWC